jgi:hypothetical protein
MTVYAVVKTEDNVCDNMVVWNDDHGPWSPPADHYTVVNDDGAGDIGWTYDPATQVWTAPPVPEPIASEPSDGPVVL